MNTHRHCFIYPHREPQTSSSSRPIVVSVSFPTSFGGRCLVASPSVLNSYFHRNGQPSTHFKGKWYLNVGASLSLAHLHLIILTQSKLVPTTTMPIREHSHLGEKSCRQMVLRGEIPSACHLVTTTLASATTPNSRNPLGREKMNTSLHDKCVPR